MPCDSRMSARRTRKPKRRLSHNIKKKTTKTVDYYTMRGYHSTTGSNNYRRNHPDDVTARSSSDDSDEDNMLMLSRNFPRSHDTTTISRRINEKDYDDVVGPMFQAESPKSNILAVCEPYLQEEFQKTILQHGPGSDRRKAMINCLRFAGVKCFIVDGSSTDEQDSSHIPDHIREVVSHIVKQKRVHGLNMYKACLLYQDFQGRLFNLKLPSFSGQVHPWQQCVNEFSSNLAISTMVVMTRMLEWPAQSFDTIEETSNENNTFNEHNTLPIFLAVFFGFVLSQELRFSMLNAEMFVKGLPSMSAYWISGGIQTDLVPKAILFCFAVACITNDFESILFRMMGIYLAFVTLLVNLGARVCENTKIYLPIYNGWGSSILSYFYAVVMGVLFPFLALNDSKQGGTRSLTSIAFSSTLAGAIYVASGIETVQSLLVEEQEHEDVGNICVGAWLAVSTILSLFISTYFLPGSDSEQFGQEIFLKEDHTSPVGYTVPHLPDYLFDPSRSSKSPFKTTATENMLLLACVILAGAVGTGVILIGLTDWGETIDNIAT